MPINENILFDVHLNLISLGRAELWPHAPHVAWVVITIGGLACATAVWSTILISVPKILRILVTSRRTAGPLIVLTTSFVASTTPLWLMLTFDRYYLLPFALLLALWTYLGRDVTAERSTRRAPVAAACVLAGLAAFDVIALHDYYDFTRARWHAANALTSEGVNGDDIDGGFEVNGLLSYHPDRPFDPVHPWYLSKTRPIVLLSLGPIVGYTPTMSYEFRRWMPPSSGAVYVLRRAKAD